MRSFSFDQSSSNSTWIWCWGYRAGAIAIGMPRYEPAIPSWWRLLLTLIPRGVRFRWVPKISCSRLRASSMVGSPTNVLVTCLGMNPSRCRLVCLSSRSSLLAGRDVASPRLPMVGILVGALLRTHFASQLAPIDRSDVFAISFGVASKRIAARAAMQPYALQKALTEFLFAHRNIFRTGELSFKWGAHNRTPLPSQGESVL